jgi:chaperone required for assembly of F1-ATPase
MNEKEIIQNLSDLQSYIEDEWDLTNPEIKEESERYSKAISLAIDIIRAKKSIGTLQLNNKTYIVSE